MNSVQYLVSGVMSLFVSAYVLVKRPKTLVLKSFFLYGLVVSLWEISNFFNSTAPNLMMATELFRTVLLTSHLCFPLYLLTILNIQQKRKRKALLLILIPAIIQMALMFTKDYMASYEFFRTETGWSYKVISLQPSLVIVGAIFVGYLIGIIVALSSLIKKIRFPVLRRKYIILFISFTLFQAIGTTLTNALTALNPSYSSLSVGGLLQFLTFLSIWYALTIKEKELPLSVLQTKNFSEVYSSFLTIFYNSTVDSQLGEKNANFREFLIQSKIENQVSLTKNEILFNEGKQLDVEELITRNLVFFEKNPVDTAVMDHYLRVLKAAEQVLDWKFTRVIKTHERFLQTSDLIYGLSDGKFLETMVEDTSLRDQDDVAACLKIYKRVLLSIIDIIQSNTELSQKLIDYPILKALTITEFGEISLNGLQEHVLDTSKEQRLSFIINNFNPLLSQIYEDIPADSKIDFTKMLNKLRLVLTLNRDRASSLGVYPTLLGTLATKIPRTQIYRLYSDYLEEMVQEKTEELKEAQENLLKTQRLATIGEAAAMVGHDLRNPLQVITYALYLAEHKLESFNYADIRKTCTIIKEQVQYMNKIVSDLQDYSRPLKTKLLETNIHELINETLVTITVPKNLKVSIVIDADLNVPKLRVDSLMIKRVFINLITNALQSMPNGGELTITASKTDETALISFRDTGVGIAEEHKSKIFQPLFTTKAKGQGLGLAVCKRLIEANKGAIRFESNVGEGTTFTVTLPLEHDEVLSTPEAIDVVAKS
jgi:signal transduction histidine kinase